MSNQTNSIWWNAQQMINRLRLRLVQERGSRELRNHFNQGHIVNGLHVVLIQASTALTRDQALQEVSDWFEEQKANTRHVYVFRQLHTMLMAVLEEAKPVHMAQSNKSSGIRPLPPRKPLPRSDVHTLDSMEIPRGTTRTSIPSLPGMPEKGHSSSELQSASTVTDMPYIAHSLRHRDANPTTSDSLDNQDFQLWWNSESVVDSMRLRLENHPMGAPLRRLLLLPDFFTTLMYILEATERLPDFKVACRNVEESLKHYCGELQPSISFSELWNLLVPLLSLRKISSASMPSVEVPWKRLQEIEAKEGSFWEEQRKLREEKKSHNDELWDWDEENKDFKEFATGAVSQILDAHRSGEHASVGEGSNSSK